MSAAGHQGSAGAGQGAEREEYGFALEGITEASPQGFSKHGSWLSPEQRIQERETKTEATESLTTSSEVTYHHSCLILLVTPINPIQCGRGLQKGMNTRNLGAHGGLSGRLATSVPRRSQRRQYCFLLTQPPSSNPH